jgi:hypothetical protein
MTSAPQGAACQGVGSLVTAWGGWASTWGGSKECPEGCVRSLPGLGGPVWPVVGGMAAGECETISIACSWENPVRPYRCAVSPTSR